MPPRSVDPAVDPPAGAHQNRVAPTTRRLAVLGNPNTGKTTLFNRLCGLRARTANFPGTTVEMRVGRLVHDRASLEVIDLPGLYSLHLDTVEAKVTGDCLHGRTAADVTPDIAVVVVDATNLQRNLLLVAEVLSMGIPTVVALNMMDAATSQRLRIDAQLLSDRLGCPVTPISARRGEGIEQLLESLDDAGRSDAQLPEPKNSAAATAWAQEIVADVVVDERPTRSDAARTIADRADAVFTHPVLGVGVFAGVMFGLFYCIFSLAQIPMDLIELLFGVVAGRLGAVLPAGAISDLLTEGVIGGLAGTIVFLPQICVLFFLLSILEDTGYLARAAFVMDRLMRRFGLSGHAFVPLLSAHACAIPAIMSAKLIPDRRDRIATILIAPFMSCSARLPVYVLLIGILFAHQPAAAGLAFAGCYVLGIVVALGTALLARRTLLRGASAPMLIELPPYRLPSVRTAVLTTWRRALMFLRKAGTVIMGICIVLWWLSAYPQVDPPAEVEAMRAQAEQIEATEPQQADALMIEAARLESRHATEHSLLGSMGKLVAPVFEPLGYDWQLSIGVVSSFAAREVFVSTMAVVLSAGDADSELDDPKVLKRIEQAQRSDGSAVFTIPTAASLLVFYVLAMQCLPTVAVTAREAGGWRWGLLQLGYMTAVAYAAAWIAFQVAVWIGGS